MSFLAILRLFYGTRPRPPVILDLIATPQTLPAGTIGVPYPFIQLQHSGGSGRVSWALVSGSLGGLNLSSTGGISGTPDTVGDIRAVLRVTDEAGDADDAGYVFVCSAPVVLDTTAMPPGIRNLAYTHTFSASGGRALYSFTISSGKPGWATLDASTGFFHGTPNAAGTIHPHILVTDADGRTDTANFSATISVTNVLITTNSLPNGVEGVAYPAPGVGSTVQQQGSSNPNWLMNSVTPTALFTIGLNTGIVSAPNTVVAGTYTVSITVVDQTTGATDTRSFTITITPAEDEIIWETSDLGFATVGSYYETTLAAHFNDDTVSAVSIVGNTFALDGTPFQLKGVNAPGLEYNSAQGRTHPWGNTYGVPTPPWLTMRDTWGINSVRIPLNQASWFGVAYNMDGSAFDPDPSDDYRATVIQAVADATAAGMVVILDLHWNCPYELCLRGNGGQMMMADSPHSVTFWTQIATQFKDNKLVMYELFNEPVNLGRFNLAGPITEDQFLLNGGTVSEYYNGGGATGHDTANRVSGYYTVFNGGDAVPPWDPGSRSYNTRSVVYTNTVVPPSTSSQQPRYICILAHVSTSTNGPGMPGGATLWQALNAQVASAVNDTWVPRSWTAAGFQAMVNAVRAAGATTPILVGCPAYAQDPRNWLTYKPTDPLNQIAAVWHCYANDPINDTIPRPIGDAAFTAADAILAAGYPVAVTEVGGPCGTGQVGAPLATRLLDWADDNTQSVWAWAWYLATGTENILIRDAAGTPTDGFGQVYKAWPSVVRPPSADTSTLSFSLIAGAPPQGLGIGVVGEDRIVLHGTPTREELASFTIRCYDVNRPSNHTDRNFTLRSANPVVLAAKTMATATVGTAYSDFITATGGYGTLTYQTTAGTMPAGMTPVGGPPVTIPGGVFGGTPTVAGSATVSVQVTDSQGRESVIRAYNFTSQVPVSAPSFTTVSLHAATAGQSYQDQLTATGGNGTYVFAKVSSTPTWAYVAANGAITGGPTVAAQENITVSVTSNGITVPATYALNTIAAPVGVDITTLTLPDMVVSTTVPAIQLTATGGSGSYVWTKLGNSVTSWLDVTTAGVLTGTVTSTPRSPISSPGFGVRCTDASNSALFDDQYYIFNVIPAAAGISITAPSSIAPNGILVGSSLSGVTLTAAGGNGTYTYSRTSLTGPGGASTWISVNPTTGAVTGTAPATTGNYVLVVGAADGVNTAGSRTYNVVVNPTAVTISATNPPSGNVGTFYSSALSASGGQGPYSSWTITANAAALSAVGITLSSSGILSGTPTGTLTAQGFTVTCQDSLATTSAPRSFSLTIDIAQTFADDWASRTAGSTMRTQFATQAEVDLYVEQNAAYSAGLHAWVNDTDTSGVGTGGRGYQFRALKKPGRTGAMALTITNAGGNDPTADPSNGNDSLTASWLRRLNDAWGPEDGIVIGETWWIYYGYYYPLSLCQSIWDWVPGGTGGWKNCGLSVWTQFHSSYGSQIVLHNDQLRDFPQLYEAIGGDYNNIVGGGSNLSGCGGNTQVNQGAVDTLARPASHPARLLTPQVPGQFDATTGTPCERARKQYGAAYEYMRGTHTNDAYYRLGTATAQYPTLPNPLGSDQSSGGVMYRRDMANKHCGFLFRIKKNNEGNTGNECEVWWHAPGTDYYPIHATNGLRHRGSAYGGIYSFGVRNEAYRGVTSIDSRLLPGGVVPMSSFYVLTQNPNRLRNTGRQPDGTPNGDITYLVDEIAAKPGAVGYAAPGFQNPPVSRYDGAPAWVPATPGQVVKFTSVTNGNELLTDVIPSDWAAITNGSSIVEPWSGGAFDYNKRIMYWSGGGHSVNYNNTIASFDFNGATMPTGWRFEDASAASLVTTGSPNPSYPDGRENSVHSYSGQCVDNYGVRWRAGGSFHSSGSATGYLNAYNTVAKTYTFYSTSGRISAQLGLICFNAPEFDRVVIISPAQGEYAVFNPATTGAGARSFVSSGTLPQFLVGGNASGAYCPISHRLIYFGGGSSSPKVVLFNGSGFTYVSGSGTTAGNMVINNAAPSGAQIIGRFGPAVANVPRRASINNAYFVAMDITSSADNPYAANSDYCRNIWTIAESGGTASAAGTFTFTRTTLTGDTVDVGSDTPRINHQKRGGYQSLYVLDGWDAFSFINRANDAMYGGKMPT